MIYFYDALEGGCPPGVVVSTAARQFDNKGFAHYLEFYQVRPGREDGALDQFILQFYRLGTIMSSDLWRVEEKARHYEQERPGYVYNMGFNLRSLHPGQGFDMAEFLERLQNHVDANDLHTAGSSLLWLANMLEDHAQAQA